MPPHHVKVPGPRGWRGWRRGGNLLVASDQQRVWLHIAWYTHLTLPVQTLHTNP